MIVSSGEVEGLTQFSSDAEAFIKILQTVDSQSCPRVFNFHMHTVCSDGKLTPEALIQQACDLSLTALAITDHHSVSGYHRAQKWLEDWRWHHPPRWSYGVKQSALPRLLTGVEITSDLAGVIVHILGYGFDPRAAELQPYLQHSSPQGTLKIAQNVINAIHRAGGVAVLAHPARYRKPPETLVAAAKALNIDGIETYYAYDNPATWRSCPKRTAIMQTLAVEYDLLSSCGTDTHGLSLLRRL